MISLEDVTLTIPAHGRRQPVFMAKNRTVLLGANLTIPADRHIALLGPSTSDNNALINLLGGVLLPRKGRITSTVKISFPVGYTGSFDFDLSARKNIVHIAELYGLNAEGTVEFVRHISDLGAAFDAPLGHLARTTMSRLAAIVAYSIPFDIYLVNNLSLGHDEALKSLFQERLRTSGMIVSTSNQNFVRQHCDGALVLSHGMLRLEDDVDEILRFMNLRKRLGPGTVYR